MRVARMATVAVILALTALAKAQKIDEFDRSEAREMLRMITEDVRKHYYDPSLHGPEFDKRVREADEKIKAAANLGQAFAMVGWALDGLHDSHTYFVPPGRTHIMQYGWRMEFIGDRCLV